MISGEPIPVDKKKGDKVLAGTINQRGSFIIKASQVGSETVLARIIRMVQEAQGSKAPVQRIVDRVTGIFVPVVLGIAVLTFVLWMVIGGTEYFSYTFMKRLTPDGFMPYSVLANSAMVLYPSCLYAPDLSMRVSCHPIRTKLFTIPPSSCLISFLLWI